MSKKVAVVCAAGKQGKLLVDEAVSRGYAVTGFVRGNAKVENVQAKTVVKDLFDLTKDDLSGFDVVIDAFGAWAPEVLPLHRTSLKHLCDILSGTDTRLLVVGGAGSLYVNKEHTLQVKNLPDFPEIYKPLASAQSAALDDLRERNDVKWTFLSPAGNFVADGERTGKYILGGEEYFVNDRGVSEISYADYAIAMIDEIENANNIQKRFSVIGE
ncbi:MAG: NAD(P)-dependent oxidoreductase [Candidatus Borkfalkiaceae bacterium]|nr:NAD(P)-dependent oxidoreductase [Christensenellaceae bacterium]